MFPTVIRTTGKSIITELMAIFAKTIPISKSFLNSRTNWNSIKPPVLLEIFIKSYILLGVSKILSILVELYETTSFTNIFRESSKLIRIL